MAVRITETTYKYYGRCLSLDNGTLRILVTMDLGPRIISFTPQGGENLFFNDDEGVRVSKGEYFDQVFGPGAEFHFYGGHRLWLAPQLPIHTSAPDNDPLDVEYIPNGAVFTGKPQEVVGMQTRMTVVMDESEPKVTVTCEFVNISSEAKSFAPWQISQMAPGGVALAAFGRRNDMQPFGFTRERMMRPGGMRPREMNLLHAAQPDKVFVLFGIGHLKDERLTLHNRVFALKQDPALPRPFKCGMKNPEGFGMYVLGDWVFSIDYQPVEGGTYTDAGSTIEVYTDAAFLELEALGEYQEVQPGEVLTHTETLSVRPRTMPLPELEDEEALHNFMWAHRG